MRKRLQRLILVIFALIAVLVFYAYARTWGKTEIEFRIHINKQLVYESAFGESPTFAIWLHDPESRGSKTVFATRRAAEGDWEGKAEVPVALPLWFEVSKNSNDLALKLDSKKASLDGSTGATPEPGYFILRVNSPPGIKLTAWIEVNLAGDYNETYQQFDEELRKEDSYGSGQPSLLYKAELEVIYDFEVEPELVGMTLLDEDKGVLVKPMEGITTATRIFDEIDIQVVKPKPKIIRKRKN